MTDSYELNGRSWRNRIVDFRETDPGQLLAHPDNPRIHPKAQQDALAGALDEIGWIATPVVNVTTGHLIDGHARVKLALRNDEKSIPVIYVELTEEEERKALATLDPIASMAGYDAEIVGRLVSGINANDQALRQVIANMARDAGVPGLSAEHEESDAEPRIERAEELRRSWKVEAGQLWRLPSRRAGNEHLVVVGDCTDAEVVGRVIGTGEADIVVTDPPYGVDYEGKTDDALKLKNDDVDELGDLLTGAFNATNDACRPGGCWYVCGPPGPQLFDFGVVLRDLGIWRQTITWAKNTMILGHSDYHYKHEIIFYGWKPGAAHQAPPDRKQTTLWEFDKPAASRLHPTIKPTPLFQRAIRNSSSVDDTVYDPFVGSGTSIVAAENLGRRARAVDVDPRYVAVALQRYVDAFGIRPERVT